MRRSMLTILTAVMALLLSGGSAQAATPFTAGTAGAGSTGNPDLAVGADGSGHLVWITGGANAQVRYCRVAPGGSACSLTADLNFGTSSAARPAGRAAVFAPAPNRVVVVATCWNCPNDTNRTFYWFSNNNGESFVPAIQIGEGFQAHGAGTWIDDFGVFVGVNAGAVRATNGAPYLPGTGPVSYATGGTFSYDPQVVRLPGTTTLVAAVNDLEVIKLGVYSGGSLAQDTVNDESHWHRDRTLPGAESVNRETALNSGPNGIFLSYLNRDAGRTRVGLRHFDPAAGNFGPPVYLQSGERVDASTLGDPDSAQDADGRVHVVWRSLYDGGRLRYRASDTGGTGFGPVGNLAMRETFTDPQVAAGPGGTGFAVWKGAGNAVRAVALDPEPEPGPAGPGGPGGPGGSGGPGGPGGPAGPAPTVSRTAIGDRTLRPGQGTNFTFVASKAGRAVLTIEKKFNGLKIKRRVKAKSGKRVVRRVCVAKTKRRLRALRKRAGDARAYRRALRRQSCRGFRQVGRIVRRVRPGRNSIQFNGRVAGRRLAPGVYRAKLIVTDSAGQRSRAEALRFRVLSPKRARAKMR